MTTQFKEQKTEIFTKAPQIALSLTPDSSQLHGYGYDEASRVLAVEFATSHEDSTYFYLDVPPTTFEELTAAKSKGSFIIRAIKPHFAYRRESKPGKEVEAA